MNPREKAGAELTDNKDLGTVEHTGGMQVMDRTSVTRGTEPGRNNQCSGREPAHQPGSAVGQPGGDGQDRAGRCGRQNRQTVIDEDAAGRALFKKWCKDAGMTMGLDTMDNMFMTRPGTESDLPAVYVGSHLDTQPTGGKYDSVLGALEVCRSLNDLGIKTKHLIVVTNWTNEESTRFAPAMLASGVFAGL